jgi:hypothetical protein
MVLGVPALVVLGLVLLQKAVLDHPEVAVPVKLQKLAQSVSSGRATLAASHQLVRGISNA